MTTRTPSAGCLVRTRGDDLGLVWYSYEHIFDLYYETPGFVKEFGWRILDFSFSFEQGARWFDKKRQS